MPTITTAIRLINLSNLRMEKFDRSMFLPTYSILSHMWFDSEVKFGEYTTAWLEAQPNHTPPPGQLQNKRKDNEYRVNSSGEWIPWGHLFSPEKNQVSKTSGWGKIAWACWKARNENGPDKATHIWIDTCYINKSDPNEEAEAIASMAKFYANAKKCYAYLQDVSALEHDWTKPGKRYANEELKVGVRHKFEHSRWFFRGWTLQELLAPSEVVFYDHDWRDLGSKSQKLTEIHRATGINRKHLQGKAYQNACVAVKMSWMARRYTSKIEDMAYALLSILGVHMNTRYGSGTTEFFRMQETLIQQGNSDESIFTWIRPTRYLSETLSHTPATHSAPTHFGLLAPWPTCFVTMGDLTTVNPTHELRRPPYRVEQGGTIFPLASLFIEDFQLKTPSNDRTANERIRYDLSLNCWVSGYENDGHVTIRLVREQPTSPWMRKVDDKLIIAECKRKSTYRSLGVSGIKVRDAKIPHVPRLAKDWGEELSKWLLPVTDQPRADEVIKSAEVRKSKFKRWRAELVM